MATSLSSSPPHRHPAVGMIHIVRQDQVRKLEVPLTAVANCLGEFGMGAGQLPAARKPAPTA